MYAEHTHTKKKPIENWDLCLLFKAELYSFKDAKTAYFRRISILPFEIIFHYMDPIERPHREWEVVGSIPSRDRQKSLKLVVVDFPLGA